MSSRITSLLLKGKAPMRPLLAPWASAFSPAAAARFTSTATSPPRLPPSDTPPSAASPSSSTAPVFATHQGVYTDYHVQPDKSAPLKFHHPPRLNRTPSPKNLPKIPNHLIGALPILTLFGLGWWAFIEHISNNEKLSSSVFRQVMFVLRTSDKIESLLGEGVHLEPTWWTGGESYIAGTIHVLKGKADLGFRIKGSKQAGQVYFTSIRPNADSAFQIIRFKIITDDGQEVELIDEMRGKGYDVTIE